MVCGFAKVTQIVLVYDFNKFFLIELDLVIVYFLFMWLKK